MRGPYHNFLPGAPSPLQCLLSRMTVPASEHDVACMRVMSGRRNADFAGGWPVSISAAELGRQTPPELISQEKVQLLDSSTRNPRSPAEACSSGYGSVLSPKQLVKLRVGDLARSNECK